MNNAFEDYIETRCEQALLANKEYRDIQMRSDYALQNCEYEKYNEYVMRMLVITENICYKLAIKDMYSLLSND